MDSEFLVFLSFIVIGIIIGSLFDFFRIIRRVFKHSDFITVTQDIAFWIISGIIILVGIFILNDGKIRAYLFVGLFIGTSLYIATISKFFIKFGIIILNAIKSIVFIPIHSFLKWLFSALFTVTNLLIHHLKKLKFDFFSNKKIGKRRNN